MRVAPPVQAPSCGAGPWPSIQRSLYAASTAVTVYWLGAQLGEPGVWLVLVSLLAGVGVAAWARGRTATPALWLGWDGGVWRLGPPGGEPRAGSAQPMLDLGPWMLVRFTPADAGRAPWREAVWLPLSRAAAGAAWPALRVALYAPQPAAPAA